MKNRIFTVLLAGILCLSNVLPVLATELAEDGLDAGVDLSADSALDTVANEENNQAEEDQSYVSSNKAMNTAAAESDSKKATKYNIKFFGNGNTSGKMDVVKNIKSDKAVTLPKNKFKKTGFVFVCWNTKIDGSGKAYTNGQKVKGLSKKNGATVNLYAMWSLKKAPDMSEYIKKSEVQKIVDTAVSQAVAEAVKDIKVEGQQGPKGDKGDPGRGIKSTAIDKDGNLIVTYTDGEKVNVGVVKGPKGDRGEDGSPDGPKEDFQRVGYVVPVSQSFPLIIDHDEFEIKISNMKFTLDEYDPAYANKYIYKCEISYEADIKQVMTDDGNPATTIYQTMELSKIDIGRKGGYIINDVYLRLPNELGGKTGVYTWTFNSGYPIKEIKTIICGFYHADNRPIEQQ